MGIFDYTSGKIKLVAQIYFWISAILLAFLGFVGFLFALVNKKVWMALLVLVTACVGILVQWAFSLMIYGFGRIVDNTDELRYENKEIKKELELIKHEIKN